MGVEIVLPPEVAEKKNRILILRNELADLFEQREFMVSQERDFLLAQYTKLIGELQYEEYALKVAVSKLKRKAELIQAKHNRGEYADMDAIERQIEVEFQEHQMRIQQQVEQVRQANALLNAPVLTEEASAEMKNIYRLLVKRLHPDWNENLTEQEQELFVRAQTAYAMADLQELRNILLVLDKVKAMDSLKDSNLDDEIAKLEKSKQDIQSKIDLLNESFPFTYRERLNDFAWVKAEQDKLHGHIKQLTEEKLIWEGYLAKLSGMYHSIPEA